MSLNSRWRSKKHSRPDFDKLSTAMQMAAELCKLPMNFDWILSVDFVSDRAMAAVNRNFVGHTGTTDVITFSYFEGSSPVFPGDTAIELFICCDVAAREGALREDSSYAFELMLYLVHGLLHAAGEDDLTEKAARQMRRRESEVLTELAVHFNFEEIFGKGR